MKCESAETKSFVYHNINTESDDQMRMAIVTSGFKDFPCAMVTFIHCSGGDTRSHPVRPYLLQTVGMKHAKQFVETGEISEEAPQ